MRFTQPPHSPPSAVPLWGAAITWLPILAGMVLGTLGRAAILVLGGHEGAATIFSVICVSAGVALGAIWFWSSIEADDWRGVLKLAAVWTMLTIAFRGLWLGLVLGGGWGAVKGDYRATEGEPGIPVLLLVLLVPGILQWRRQRAVAGEDGEGPLS